MPTTVFPTPDTFRQFSVRQLLDAAAHGRIGFDQRLMADLLDRGEATIEDLVSYALEDHEEQPIAIDEDILHLLRHFRTPRAVPVILHYLKTLGGDAPELLLHTAVPFREQLVPELVKLYAEMDETEAGDVAFLLAGFRIRRPEVLAILLDRFEFDAQDGAFLLGMYGDPAAKPKLEAVLREPGLDEELAGEIREALSEIDAAAPVNWEEQSFDILAAYPEQAGPQFDVLGDADRLALLASESAEYRRAALDDLQPEEVEDPEYRALVEKIAESDPDVQARAKAWETFSAIAPDDEEAAAKLRRVMTDAARADGERAGALIAMATAFPDDPEVEKALPEFYGKPECRAQALKAMWRTFERKWGAYFPKHLHDADPDVQDQAILGAGYLAVSSAAPVLEKFFTDERLRPQALLAYALCAPGETKRSNAKGLFKKIDKLAGGLDEEECEVVQTAIDQRLAMRGLKPVFLQEERHEADAE